MTITKCPTCGSAKIRKVQRDVCGQFAGRPYRAIGVRVYQCPVCGEEVYDPVAMEKIEHARMATRERRRASAG